MRLSGDVLRDAPLHREVVTSQPASPRAALSLPGRRAACFQVRTSRPIYAAVRSRHCTSGPVRAGGLGFKEDETQPPSQGPDCPPVKMLAWTLI